MSRVALGRSLSPVLGVGLLPNWLTRHDRMPPVPARVPLHARTPTPEGGTHFGVGVREVELVQTVLPCVQKAAHSQGPVSARDRAGWKAAERAGAPAPGMFSQHPGAHRRRMHSCGAVTWGFRAQRGVQGASWELQERLLGPGPPGVDVCSPRGPPPDTASRPVACSDFLLREGGHSQGLLPQSLQLVPVLLAELLRPLVCIHRARLARHSTFHHLPRAGHSAKSRPSPHTRVGGFGTSYW